MTGKLPGNDSKSGLFEAAMDAAGAVFDDNDDDAPDIILPDAAPEALLIAAFKASPFTS